MSSTTVSVAHLTNNDSFSHGDRLMTRQAPTDGLIKTETDTAVKPCDAGMCSQSSQQNECGQCSLSACELGEASTADMNGIVANIHSPPSLTQVEDGNPNHSTESVESSSQLMEGTCKYSACESDTPSPKTRKTVHFATPLVTEVFFPTCEDSKPMTANAASVSTKATHCATPLVAEASSLSAGEQSKPLTANTTTEAIPFAAEAIHSHAEHKPPLASDAATKTASFALVTAYTDCDNSNSQLPTTDDTTACDIKSIHSIEPSLTQATQSASDNKKAPSSLPYMGFISTPCMTSSRKPPTRTTITAIFMPNDGDLHVHDHSRRELRPLHSAVKPQCSHSTFCFSAFTVSL